jgi:hypothetical protein
VTVGTAGSKGGGGGGGGGGGEVPNKGLDGIVGADGAVPVPAKYVKR